MQVVFAACTFNHCLGFSVYFPCFCCAGQWQEVVKGFRAGMPAGRRRVKMKAVDDAFSGSEAVDWLLQYMQSSGKFNSVSRPQVREGPSIVIAPLNTGRTNSALIGMKFPMHVHITCVHRNARK